GHPVFLTLKLLTLKSHARIAATPLQRRHPREGGAFSIRMAGHPALLSLKPLIMNLRGRKATSRGVSAHALGHVAIGAYVPSTSIPLSPSHDLKCR
ncbi:MAG: hypothetical protein ABIP44_00620, partial [Pseudoxanthomonas sp.]